MKEHFKNYIWGIVFVVTILGIVVAEHIYRVNNPPFDKELLESDLAGIEESYHDNRDSVQTVVFLLSKHDNIKRVDVTNHVWLFESNEADPQELIGYPDLFNATNILQTASFQWRSFEKENDGDIIYCNFGTHGYGGKLLTNIRIIFCAIDPQTIDRFDYCIKLDDNCWLTAVSHGLV